MTRAVLFDLDGTLVDTIALIVEAMEFAYEGRPLRPTRAEWEALIGTPLDAMLRRWATDDVDVEALRARYREYQWAHHDRLTRVYPGVVDTVRMLHARGLALGIVTSKIEPSARTSLRFVGIEECFTVVVGLDSTVKHKPDPEPVQFALAALGVAASEAVFVGDSTHDIAAGRAAGVRTIGVTWGPYTREVLAAAEPDAIIDAMPELLPLL
ncbi:MAG: HAD-IA family hydrolase [Gemmatimonadaceae bacterium]|nr:HAD-IA family hydrolase [Gemmatimonadaceae bacterium]